jgi:hypothetical protein
MKSILSVREIWRSKKIYWVKSYKTLLRYVSHDYYHILKPIVKGTGSGRRYFVWETDLDNLLKKFENSEL